MSKYELSISSEYVPDWGVVEAVREFFQNSLDEQTRDPNNIMFFKYDSKSETLYIGNKYGQLDPKTLLLGYTDKNSQPNMIGNHGEGYKIATVVLLRCNKNLKFFNYGREEVWIPRFVDSRRYKTKVTTFFVEKQHIWDKIPDNDLTIAISGITSDEYTSIVESNLHLQDSYEQISTDYGELLTSEEHKNKIFVSGLYICSDNRLNIGVNFKPMVVRLERDRNMVNSFDVQWYVSKMIARSNNLDLIETYLPNYAGSYINYDDMNYSVGDAISRKFFESYGDDAVPVHDQKDSLLAKSKNTIIVSKSQRDLILDSKYYQDNIKPKLDDTSEKTLYDKLYEFGMDIASNITEDQLKYFLGLIKPIKDMKSLNQIKEDDNHV